MKKCGWISIDLTRLRWYTSLTFYFAKPSANYRLKGEKRNAAYKISKDTIPHCSDSFFIQ
jgi:hypothetical protein